MTISEIILVILLILLACSISIFPIGYICLIDPIREKNSKKNFPEWWAKWEEYQNQKNIYYKRRNTKIDLQKKIEIGNKYYPKEKEKEIECWKTEFLMAEKLEKSALDKMFKMLIELEQNAEDKKIYNTIDFSMEKIIF